MQRVSGSAALSAWMRKKKWTLLLDHVDITYVANRAAGNFKFALYAEGA